MWLFLGQRYRPRWTIQYFLVAQTSTLLDLILVYVELCKTLIISWSPFCYTFCKIHSKYLVMFKSHDHLWANQFTELSIENNKQRYTMMNIRGFAKFGLFAADSSSDCFNVKIKIMFLFRNPRFKIANS